MAQLHKRVDVPAFLQKKQNEESSQMDNSSDSWWAEFESLYNKRLWHQLTVKLLAYVKQPKVDMVGLYENFIADFETKLNALSLVEIIALIIKDRPDSDEVIAFLGQVKEKVKANSDASILCSILAGRIKLVNGDLPGVKAILEEIGPIVDEDTGITPVHGRYFQLSSDYHQKVGNHNEYYREALRYLGCIKIEEVPVEELKERSFALALAALLGDSIYNFGELLQHPILEHLRRETPWLVDLLAAFNAGDLARYEQLKPQWSGQPDLRSHELPLRQKISLLCLMEMTFKSSNGVLTFDEIAGKTHLPLIEVELLVMKALSLNLVRGTVDEVDQRVHLTWVQPRVLDKTQIATLRTKLDTWCRDISSMEKLMELKAHDIIG